MHSLQWCKKFLKLRVPRKKETHPQGIWGRSSTDADDIIAITLHEINVIVNFRLNQIGTG